MAKLPDYDLDDLPSEFNQLPHGRYLILLIKLKRYYAKESKRPYLVWWWKIVEGEPIGCNLVSSTGIGTKKSAPFMNILLEAQLKAMEIEYSRDIKTKDLLYRRVTLDIEYTQGEIEPIVRMMPEKYYGYSYNWRQEGWIYPSFSHVYRRVRV